MLGTLTVTGPLDTLADIAVQLNKDYSDGVTAKTAPLAYQGWTVSGARALLDALAPNPRTALETVVLAGGYAADDDLRAKIGDSLRGATTGPITKQVQKLQKVGTLPDGVPSPIRADYDLTITSRQRTRGLVMDDGLVPVFRAALGK